MAEKSKTLLDYLMVGGALDKHFVGELDLYGKTSPPQVYRVTGLIVGGSLLLHLELSNFTKLTYSIEERCSDQEATTKQVVKFNQERESELKKPRTSIYAQ